MLEGGPKCATLLCDYSGTGESKVLGVDQAVLHTAAAIYRKLRNKRSHFLIITASVIRSIAGIRVVQQPDQVSLRLDLSF